MDPPLRLYQKQLLAQASAHDVIVFLDTGMGKTRKDRIRFDQAEHDPVVSPVTDRSVLGSLCPARHAGGVAARRDRVGAEMHEP